MQKKLAESAALWLFQPSELFNGFENVCYYLDVEPSLVRRWAKTMSREQVAKIEHLEREQRQLQEDDDYEETALVRR